MEYDVKQEHFTEQSFIEEKKSPTNNDSVDVASAKSMTKYY